MKIKFFILLIYLIQSNVLTAATYYVATNGNNSNSGSLTNPWLSIQYAADTVSAGDTVIIEDGSYNPFHVTQNGNATNQITIKARNKLLVTINGNEIYGGRNAGIHITSDYITIDGINIISTGSPASLSGERGIRLSGDPSTYRKGNIIRNNKVSGAGWVGITTSYADDVIIEYNDISNSVNQHGIYVANSADRPVVRGNIIRGNNQAGLHMNGDGDSPGDGVISNALIENNIIYGNSAGAGSSAINLDGVNNSTIRNNLLFNNYSQGISNFKIDGTLPSSNNKILNNTIVMASSAFHALKFRNGSTNGYVRNNIIIQQGTGVALASDTSSMSGLNSDYNIIIHTTSANSAIENYSSMSNWQTSTGNDLNSLTVTGTDTANILSKIFVNPVTTAVSNYNLTNNSPAIDRGVAESDVPTDINEITRPLGNAFDIGAYEYIGSNIMPTPQNVRIIKN